MRETRPSRSARDKWRFWLLAALAVVLLAGFVWIALEIRTDSSLVSWDARVTDAIVSIRTADWSRVFWSITLLGNTPVMAALSFMTVVLLAAFGRRAWAVLMAGSLLTAEGVSELAKAVVQRPRPSVSVSLLQLPGSFSLPSGHAFLTLVFLGLLAVMTIHRIRYGRGPAVDGGLTKGQWFVPVASIIVAVAAAVVVLVGLSRVYLGVHWMTDVLAGWCLGGAWLAAVLAALPAWERGVLRARDTCPWSGKALRLGLAAVLGLIVVAAVILSARADPLLALAVR